MDSTNLTLALFTGMPGWGEMLIIGALGVLIFGKRLPDVGRNIGKGIVEFKKGLKGVKDEIDDAVDQAENDSNNPQLEQKQDQYNAIDTQQTKEKENA